MDWFSWLSKTHLEPPFIHEYAIVFSHNQLEQEDISYFNHEFLQSMGITIAKHRLEILKLARESTSGSHPMAKIITAIKKTKITLAGYVRTWVQCRRHDSAAAVVMVQKRRSYSSRWKGAMLKRNSRLVTSAAAKHGGSGGATLLLTNGQRRRPVVGKSGGAKVNSFSSPLDYNFYRHYGDQDKADDDGDDHREINCFSDDDDGASDGGGGRDWSGTGGEEIKWDAMFHNLKPT